jgi:hypothetical protein
MMYFLFGSVFSYFTHFIHWCNKGHLQSPLVKWTENEVGGITECKTASPFQDRQYMVEFAFGKAHLTYLTSSKEDGGQELLRAQQKSVGTNNNQWVRIRAARGLRTNLDRCYRRVGAHSTHFDPFRRVNGGKKLLRAQTKSVSSFYDALTGHDYDRMHGPADT